MMVRHAAAKSRPSSASTGVRVPTCGALAGDEASLRIAS